MSNALGLTESNEPAKLCTSQFQNRPSPPPPPPRQSLGIWLALSSVQWGIWPKWGPPGGAFDFPVKNIYQRSEPKGFRNCLIQHVSCFDGSMLLLIPSGFFWIVVVLYSYVVKYAFV